MWILRSNGDSETDLLTFRILAGGVKTIGRSRGVDFTVDAPLVSRVHCRLSADANGTLILEDLDSTNGTFVNGARLKGKTQLKPGDQLRVGRVVLIVGRDAQDET